MNDVMLDGYDPDPSRISCVDDILDRPVQPVFHDLSMRSKRLNEYDSRGSWAIRDIDHLHGGNRHDARFENLVEKNISSTLYPHGWLADPTLWMIAVLVLFTGTLFVGAYPALLLSSFNPAQVLKGLFDNARFVVGACAQNIAAFPAQQRFRRRVIHGRAGPIDADQAPGPVKDKNAVRHRVKS